MIRKTYDFAAKEAQYAEYDLASLLHARNDAMQAEINFRGMEAENYYRDDFLTLCDIIRKRRATGETLMNAITLVDAEGREYQFSWELVNVGSAEIRLAIKPDFQTVLREGQIHPSGRKLQGQCWHGK